MATKRITSEDLVLNLILNADKVEPGNKKLLGELYALDRATRDLETQMLKLNQQKKLLNKSSADYKTKLAAIEVQMKKVQAQIDMNRAAMMKLRETIGRAGLTINQLNSLLQSLKIQLANATDPKTLARLRKEIRLTEMQMERMRTGMSRVSQAWRHMGQMANRYGAIIGWTTGIVVGFGMSIMGITRNFRQLDKQFSNVMKTTALTRGEVMRLKRDFDQLNEQDAIKTPTKTKELLEISRIAGRLGIRGVENIRDFTLAVDKLYVALGEDLEGSVEEVAEKVGKLVNVFQLDKEMPLSEALLRAGSLINELGKSSAANASTILNYTSRLGGVGSMAKFTIDQLAGLGAALDSMGVPAERGSTAVVKLISALGTEAEIFSRIMGLDLETYTNRLKTNANAVLLEMIELSAGGNESIMDVLEGMDAMDVNGVRVAETFGKLATGMDAVVKQQDIAARAFSSSASVMNEFYIMSKDYDSLMAIQGKRIKSLADDYSKSLSPAIYKFYRGLIDVLFALRDASVWIAKHTHLLAGLTAVWVLFKSARIGKYLEEAWIYLKLWAGDLKRATVAAWANNASIVAMKAAYTAAGGGIKGATAALKAFGAALLRNPWTAAVAVIAGLAAAFFLTRRRIDEVKLAIRDFNTDITTQTVAMEHLFESAKKAEEGSIERANAIRNINEIYGEYLPKLLTEADNITTIGDAYEYANGKLREQIALKFRNDRYNEIIRKTGEERSKKQERMLGSLKTTQGAFAYGQAMFETDQVVSRLANMTNQTAISITISGFLKKWGLENQASRKAFLELIELRKDEMKIESELEQSIAGYISGGKGAGKGKDGGTGEWVGMSDADFEKELAKLKLAFDQERLVLLQRYKDKDALRKMELKAEQKHLQAILELTEKKWTNKDGKLTGGEQEILDAKIALQENLMEQYNQGNDKKQQKTFDEKAKEDFQQQKVLLMQMLDEKKITQEQYDILMLQMEADFNARMIAIAKKAGLETLDYEEGYFNARIQLREKLLAYQDKVYEATAWAFKYYDEIKPEDDPGWNQNDADLADNVANRYKKVRQFMQLDKSEDLESEFGVFDTNNFEGQLQQLADWYNQGILNHEEYERRKTEITREQNKFRLDIAEQGLQAINDLLGASANYFQAQKEKELKAVGNNKRKQDAINRKYAKKEQGISVAQATISGAMSIMRILEGKVTGNPLIDSIIKGVLIAATVATTGIQIGTIKAQQFAKGRYPVMGRDDKKVYNADYVGVPRTGIYNRPSLGLFSEKPEMVIDNPTLRNIQINNPGLIDAILSHRNGGGRGKGQGEGVRQFADGNYIASMKTGGQSEQELRDLIAANTAAMEGLKNLTVVASIEMIERERDNYMKIMNEKGMK